MYRWKIETDGLVSLEEQVCMFLHMLAHLVKNRTIGYRFMQSGETIRKYFNCVKLSIENARLKILTPMATSCTTSLRYVC